MFLFSIDGEIFKIGLNRNYVFFKGQTKSRREILAGMLLIEGISQKYNVIWSPD